MWAKNISKYKRVQSKFPNATEQELIQEYIKIGGLVDISYLPVIAETITTTPEIVISEVESTESLKLKKRKKNVE